MTKDALIDNVHKAIYYILIPVEPQCLQVQEKNSELIRRCAEAAVNTFFESFVETKADQSIKNLPTIHGYVLYNPTTELFYTGRYPRFGSKPKIWRELAFVKSYITLSAVHTYGYKSKEDTIVVKKEITDCVVIDLSTQKPIPNFSVLDYAMEKAKNILKKPYYSNWKIVVE